MPDGPRHIRVFDVADGTLSGGRVFATCTVGLFDGFRLDDAGRIWTSAGDGVHCYDPDGTLIGKIRVPEPVANVVFGGPNATACLSAPRPRSTPSSCRYGARRCRSTAGRPCCRTSHARRSADPAG